MPPMPFCDLNFEKNFWSLYNWLTVNVVSVFQEEIKVLFGQTNLNNLK